MQGSARDEKHDIDLSLRHKFESATVLGVRNCSSFREVCLQCQECSASNEALNPLLSDPFGLYTDEELDPERLPWRLHKYSEWTASQLCVTHQIPLCMTVQVSVAESSALEAPFVQMVLEGCLDCVCVKKKGRTLTLFR